MRGIFVVLTLLLSTSFFAQTKRVAPIFNLNGGNYINKGWHFAPGITYMLPTEGKRNVLLLQENAVDTLFTGEYKTAGKVGIYFEIGRLHLYDRKVINGIDYGIGFKSLKGKESFDGLIASDVSVTPFSYEANYKNSFITGFFNLSNYAQLSEKTFLHNSIGLNADYRIINKTDDVLDYGSNMLFPKAFVGQLHYKFGFGFKAKNNLYVVPAIETPILGIYEWNDGKSTLQYFNTSYRPLIISLRFFWLDDRPTRDCVGAPAKKTGDQLWGSNMRKGKKKRRKRKRSKVN